MNSQYCQANKELGKRIASIRTARGISQEAVAAALGISKSMVHKYEHGQAVLPAVMIRRLAAVLQVSIDELLGDGDGKAEPLPPLPPAIGRLVHQISALEEWHRDSVVAVAIKHIETIKQGKAMRAKSSGG